jgi:hypothetical protein
MQNRAGFKKEKKRRKQKRGDIGRIMWRGKKRREEREHSIGNGKKGRGKGKEAEKTQEGMKRETECMKKKNVNIKVGEVGWGSLPIWPQ